MVLLPRLIIDSENPNAWSQKGFTQYFGFNSKQEACECWKRAKNLGDQGAINAIDEYCNSFLNLKLIRRYNDYNRAHIILEFKNKSNKHIDKLWLKAELRDKEGSYLAGTEYIHFTNIHVTSHPANIINRTATSHPANIINRTVESNHENI